MKPDKSHVHHFLLRMGYKHNEVALLLGGVKMLFIAMVFFGSSLNDHVMIPLVLALAIILGIWLDERTLKRLKMIYKSAPARMDVDKTRRKQRKVRIAQKVFDHNKINMN